MVMKRRGAERESARMRVHLCACVRVRVFVCNGGTWRNERGATPMQSGKTRTRARRFNHRAATPNLRARTAYVSAGAR